MGVAGAVCWAALGDIVGREVLSVFASAGLAALVTAKSGESNGLIYRKSGRTSERVSAIGLGGAHLGRSDAAEAIRIGDLSGIAQRLITVVLK